MYAVTKKMTKLNYDQNESCGSNFHSGSNSIFVIFLLTPYIYVHPIGRREQCHWGPFRSMDRWESLSVILQSLSYLGMQNSDSNSNCAENGKCNSCRQYYNCFMKTNLKL